MVVTLLTKLVRRANIQETSKAQPSIHFLSFLKQFAKSQYNAWAEMVPLENEGVRSCPETGHYPPRNYAQSPKTRLALAGLRTVTRGPEKSEWERTTRLNQVICRCGNRHPIMRSVVVRYSVYHSWTIYLNVLDFSWHWRDAVRSRTLTPQSSNFGEIFWKTAFCQATQFSREHIRAFTSSFYPTKVLTEVFELINHQYLKQLALKFETFMAPSTLDWTKWTLTSRPNFVPPPQPPCEDRKTQYSQPSWLDRRRLHRLEKPMAIAIPTNQLLTCYKCYIPYHAASECTHPLWCRKLVTTNYETLFPVERATVPAVFHHWAEKTVGAPEQNKSVVFSKGTFYS